ncbi:MAG TPA: hypothetical protein VHL31_10570 [Geminicoccus sp.]|jgi:hypothetical protein|uniref:hypothetical protein n=1 Tax=Geminicoccus sp. TaxID=2024832 RepID=UPI002E2F2F9D|nr:hypothetical protein [Geminicoccus sp.]HEX2526724.1 hypothetical protein [Geminicoccus sp.]
MENIGGPFRSCLSGKWSPVRQARRPGHAEPVDQPSSADFDRQSCRQRNLAERLVAKPRQCRLVAARYDMTWSGNPSCTARLAFPSMVPIGRAAARRVTRLR